MEGFLTTLNQTQLLHLKSTIEAELGQRPKFENGQYFCGVSTEVLPTDEEEVLLKTSGLMNKISIIKSVRSRFNLGLKEAKDIVDKWYRDLPNKA